VDPRVKPEDDAEWDCRRHPAKKSVDLC